MDGQFFIATIGKALESAEVRDMLAKVGVTEQLRIPKGDIEARADLPQHGLSLIFKPEGPKSSRLLFNAVQFFSEAEAGNHRFPGALPGGLSFDDGAAQVHAKLGPPVLSKPNLRKDFWNLGPLRMGVNYAKAEPNHIAAITVHQPAAA